jgi:hypothetical protein
MSDILLKRKILKLTLSIRKFEIRYAKKGEVHDREKKITVTGYQGVFLLVPSFSRRYNYRIQFLQISLYFCICP